MGVKERKALEKQMRRNQILDAARHVLFSSGIDSISMSRIAEQAELGVGTIYFYYKNKEEIFVALQEEGLSLLYDMICTIVEEDIPHDEKLVRIAMCYYRFSLEQKNYFDIINYFLSSPRIFFEPDLKTRIDMSGRKILAAIRDIVSKGVSKGIFAEKYPEKFSVMFWAALHGLIHFRKLEKTTLENESIEQFYEYSVHKLISSIRQ